MAEITPLLVRDLRERTGAGMMDCKKALVENGGEMEAAIDWLRKKGLSSAAKKAGRAATEGLVGVASGPKVAGMVEVNAETDFVGRSEPFQNFVAEVAGLTLSVGDDVEALKAATYPGTLHTVGDELTRLIATIGEHMTIRRAKVLRVESGIVATYMHNAIKPGLGKIGVLVGLEAPSEIDALEVLGRQIGMHVAAAKPEALEVSGVDPSALHREQDVLSEQARASGKPEAIIAKMVEGRIRKYYEEVVLLEQVWVHDGESRVKVIVEKAGAKLTGFARFHLGEGVEKAPAADFAAEVAAAAGTAHPTTTGVGPKD